jgi:putative ABC transport system permease protein
MTWFRRVVSGAVALFRWRRVEQDLDEELRAYLEASIDARMRDGLSRNDATLAARRALGSVDAVKDHTRDAGWEAGLESVWRDVRYAVRALRQAPGFSAVAVIILSVGIGATTAVFQLADAIRLRPLPVAHPEELVEVRMADPTRGRMGTFAGRRPLFTYALWEEFRQRQHAFAGVLAWSAYPVNLSARGEARFVQGVWVSGDYFRVLGVVPHLGRVFSSSDDRPGCGSPGAVLGYAFWQRQYGADPRVIGQTISLNGQPFEVIGVASRGFVGLEVGRTFDVATPLCAERILNREHSALGDRSWWWLTVIGRLAPGWSVERASSYLAGLSPGVFESTRPAGLPPDVARAYVTSTLRAFPAATGVSGTVREEYEAPVWVLLAVAGAVLLIAAANLATLLLARASTREREIGVRLALGASRARVIRQLLTESALLGVAGAGTGLVLAVALGRGLIGLLQTSGFQFFAVTFILEPNWRVLVFATAVTLVTCLLFGLAPAIVATRPAGTLLRTTSRTSTAGPVGSAARGSLVVAQVALSLVLVVTAVLFARTLHNLITLDSGFEPDRMTTVLVDYQRANTPAASRLELQQRLLHAVRSLPSVESAASVRMVPLTGEWTGHVAIEGVRHQTQAYFNVVSPGFFHTIGSRVIAGRDFSANDSHGSPPVAVVNELFARKLLGTRNPVGLTFELPGSPAAPHRTFQIVGLVPNTKYTGLRDPFEPIAFFPVSQDPQPLEYVNLIVRAAAPSIALTRSLSEAIRRTELDAALFVVPFSVQISDALVRERLLAMLSGFFAGIATMLALLGLYGVVAYGVTQRTREIGIRTALGAQPAEVLRLVLGQSLCLTVVGVALGLGGAAAATRYLEGMLFGLTPTDAGTFIGVTVAFPLVAAWAAYLPARRASRMDPLIALRCE